MDNGSVCEIERGGRLMSEIVTKILFTFFILLIAFWVICLIVAVSHMGQAVFDIHKHGLIITTSCTESAEGSTCQTTYKI